MAANGFILCAADGHEETRNRKKPGKDFCAGVLAAINCFGDLLSSKMQEGDDLMAYNSFIPKAAEKILSMKRQTDRKLLPRVSQCCKLFKCHLLGQLRPSVLVVLRRRTQRKKAGFNCGSGAIYEPRFMIFVDV